MQHAQFPIIFGIYKTRCRNYSSKNRFKRGESGLQLTSIPQGLRRVSHIQEVRSGTNRSCLPFEQQFDFGTPCEAQWSENNPIWKRLEGPSQVRNHVSIKALPDLSQSIPKTTTWKVSSPDTYSKSPPYPENSCTSWRNAFLSHQQHLMAFWETWTGSSL